MSGLPSNVSNKPAQCSFGHHCTPGSKGFTPAFDSPQAPAALRVRVRVRVSAELVRDRTGYFNRQVEVEVEDRARRTELTIWVGRLAGRLELAICL